MKTWRRHFGALVGHAVVSGLVLHLLGVGTAAAPKPPGQTLTVTSLLDGGSGSLRAAILTANATPGPATIDFAPGLKGTIILSNGVLTITDDLTINGPGAKQLIVSGDGASRVFAISGASTKVTINDLTITKGLVSEPGGTALGAGLLNSGASVHLSKVVLSSNQATGQQAGGGAVANLGGTFTADHTDFLDNTATSADGHVAFGGALYNDQGAVVSLDHTAFSNDVVHGGNANGGAIGAAGGSQVTVGWSSFVGNTANGSADDGAFGGAIAVQRIGLVTSDPATMTIPPP